MFRITGREVVGKGRLGRYVVEFSRPWPANARNIYLIAEFTGWFPGHIKLRKKGRRGYIRVKLYPGIYAYGFIVDNDYSNILDPENNEVMYVKPFYDWRIKLKLSKAVVPHDSDPLNNIVHIETEASYLHRFLNDIIFRIRVPKELSTPLLVVAEKEIGPATNYVFEKMCIYEYHVKQTDLDDVVLYKFRIPYKGTDLYYGDEGVSEKSSYIAVAKNSIPGHTRRKWFMGTVYYQIFVDSFENGDTENDPPNKIKKYIPRERGYYGGDLRGIISRIHYILDLGAEALYLTPIFPSPSYHRYDVIDYYDIDKYVGTLDELKELIELLHMHNIKLVLDIPMHHTSPCFSLFIKALKEGPESKYWEWYNFLEVYSTYAKDIMRYLQPECRAYELDTLYLREKGIKPFYESFFNLWSMPKINHDNPDTLRYFIKVTQYWIKKGINGFRIDVALGIHYQWLKAYYQLVKEINDDFLVLGELNDYPGYYSEFFDSVMDYYWRKALLLTVIDNELDTKNLIYYLNRLYSEIPHYISIALYHSLGTHDTPRIKTIIGKDKDKLKLLYVLLFALPGSPAIYYGDEIGMEGNGDPDNRRPMIWDHSLWDLELLNHIKRLIHIHKENLALRIGYVHIHAIDTRTLVIERWFNEEKIYVIVNIYSNENKVKTLIHGTYIDLYNNKLITIDNAKLELPRYGFLILKEI